MPLDSSRAGILDETLREAGIPIDGVSVSDLSTNPPAVTVQYRPEATAEQITLGEQIKGAFDWRRRRALDRSTVVTAYQALTTTQQNAVLRHLLMEFARSNPRLVARINAALGVALTVDEVDPN